MYHQFKKLLPDSRILWLLAFNFLIRLVVILTTNLGVDEAYYFTYARKLQWSYFDHPPLVGWLIFLTTFGLHFVGEFFVRLGPLIIGTFNIWLIYASAKMLQGKTAGFWAALLASASIYISILAGSFILPDTPLSLFWLLSVYFALKLIKTGQTKWLYLFGLTAGLAFMSKYQAVFLWMGLGLFILFRRPSLLKSKALYGSVVLSLLLYAPVFIWNFNNHLASISFHSSRIGFGQIRWHWFFQELLGQFGYNNPVNVVIIVSSIVLMIRSGKFIKDEALFFLLWSSFPLIFISLFISLFSRTLPHWSGPAYYGLIISSAYILATLNGQRSEAYAKRFYWANGLLFSVVLAGTLYINFGLGPKKQTNSVERLGKNDFTLDLYGWDQAGKMLNEWLSLQDFGGKPYALVMRNWFPAAQLDYYAVWPNNQKLWVYGNRKELHHYATMNQRLCPVKIGTDLVYITASNNYKPLPERLTQYFESVNKPVVLAITRRGIPVYNLIIYRLRSARQQLDSECFIEADQPAGGL